MIKFFIRLIGIYLNTLSLIAPKLAGKQCFYIFCIPFKAKLKPRQQAFLNTGNPSDVDVDGIQVKKYTWGKGPRHILFVHGWQSNAYRWKNYIDSMDHEAFTLHAFDAPGHGNSGSLYANVPLYEKALLNIVAEIPNLDSIVAHSIGSFACFYYLHEHQPRINKFISMAPPFRVDEFVGEYRKQLGLWDRPVKHMVDYFVTYAGKEVYYFDLDKLAPKLTYETLLIHDLYDKDTDYKHSERLHDIMQDATLFSTDSFGHKLKSPVVIRKIIDFIG